MKCAIGCDIGTQGLKVLLWGEDGSILGVETEEFPVLYPRPAWAEQEVGHWWRAMLQAIPRLCARAGVRPEEIVAIGVDGTVDGFVPVGEKGEPLAPYILWMDRRAVQECEEIATRVSSERLFRLTGLNLDASHTAPKMLWTRANLPQVYARTWKLMPSTTYMVYLLTGEAVVDYSQASSTMLFDVAQRRWASWLLQDLGIDPQLLPEVRPATEVAGHLTREAAQALGLRPATLVAVGCGDEHASCVGAGVLEPGIVADILGTAEPVCVSSVEPAFDPTRLVETHCHAHPERWLLENPGFVSGGNYRWFRDHFYGPGVSYEVLNREAEAVAPGAEGVIFLPCMMGAMAPEWNNKARGVFYGLTLAHGRGHLTRAILEGAAYALRSIVESMRGAGCETSEIRAVGGGARSRLMRQVRADVTGLPVVTVSTVETAALGAALLAAVGCGLGNDLQEVAGRTVRVAECVEPNPKNRALYDQAYSVFLRVYESLRECFALCAGPENGKVA
ncbi:MAG: xylulokinase [Anaerolineae bacterium]